jgi:hypothetical protein
MKSFLRDHQKQDINSLNNIKKHMDVDINMDRITRLIIVISLVFCLSCASKKEGAPLFWQESPETQLFNSAEQQYQDEAYKQALLLYSIKRTDLPENI